MRKIYIVTLLEIKGRTTRFATVKTYDTAEAAAKYVCTHTQAVSPERIIRMVAENGEYSVHCRRKERPLEVFSIESCLLEEKEDKEKAS